MDTKINERKWISVQDKSTKPDIIIMQWNTLARSLCNQESFPMADPNALDWSRRFALMMEQINTVNPDILCLQEVDQFETFQSALPGYKGVFYKKQNVTNLDGVNATKGADTRHGGAVFLRSDIVVHDYEFFRLGNNSTQVAIWMEVEVRGATFAVICTHLKAKPENEAIRVRQCEVLLKALLWRPLPVVICGDFNDIVGSKPIELMSKTFISAYDQHHPKPFNTTSKKRETVVTRAIDYIWTSPSIHVSRLLRIHRRK
jgi:endonuclease/exonuclease/phosphatase family metal-dependent hydrolase